MGLLAGVLMSDPASAGSPAHCAMDHLGVVDTLTVTQEGGNIKFEFDNYVEAADPFPNLGFIVERNYWIGASLKVHFYPIEDTASPFTLSIDANRNTFADETFNPQNSFAIAAYCLDGDIERTGRSYPSTFFKLRLQRHPGAPRNLRAEVGETSITLTWEASDTANRKFAPSGYSISRYVDGTLESESETSGLTHTDTGLTAGTTYEYRVTSLAYNWEGETSRISVIPGVAPDVNDDDAVDANDALILYYAYSLRSELGTGRGAGGDTLPSYQSGSPAGALFQGCAACPEMVVVPSGTFQMGSPEGEGDDDEYPQHQVTIDDRFAVGRYEVTFAEWDACHAAGGCSHDASGDEGWGRGNRPVIDVSWDDAKEYVAWLSQETGDTYRLLSESEWEYAARAGSTTARPWGAAIGSGHANCDGCGSTWDDTETAPVGSFAANQFGLYDMLGNVWEWVEDCQHTSYNSAPADGTAWVDESVSDGNCNVRIQRGGAWDSRTSNVRSANRFRDRPDTRYKSSGFRVARDLD